MKKFKLYILIEKYIPKYISSLKYFDFLLIIINTQIKN